MNRANGFGILPVEKKEVTNNNSSEDDRSYMQGRDDAIAELTRDASVYYTTQREIDTYNMGYSSGEL